MLPKDRVAAAFEHQPTDRIPIYQSGFSSRAASMVLGREAYVGGGIQQFREVCALWDGPDAHEEFIRRSRQDAWDLARKLDLDIVRPAYWRLTEKPTRRIDEHTFFFGSEDREWKVMRFDPQHELFPVVDRGPAGALTLEGIERRVIEMEESTEIYPGCLDELDDYMAANEELGSERMVYGIGVGIGLPYESIWLEAIAARRDLVKRYLDVVADRACRMPAKLAEMGLKYIFGGGDFASKHGPFYSPLVFRELMLPPLKRISEACHAAGTYHLFASDGNLWPVADDLFGASGVDGYYEVDRQSGMDLRRLRRTFLHLILLGGISSETLHIGSKEDVIHETRDALDAAKEYGSIVVGCSNQIVPPTPAENFWAMMDTLHSER